MLVEQGLHGPPSAATGGPLQQNSWSFLPLRRTLGWFGHQAEEGGKRLAENGRAFCLDKRTFHGGGLKRPAGRKDDQIHKHKDLIHTQKHFRSEWELVRP
jgi:hypothetical protein